MNHGGKRQDAGRKNSWNTEKSESVIMRVPKKLADCLLQVRELDVPVSSIIIHLDSLRRKHARINR